MYRESLLVLALSVVVSGSAPRATSPLPSQFTAGPSASYREIRNVMGRCLDVTGGINANRTKVQIFDCNGTKSQQWVFRDLRLQNAMGRCLDVAGGINANRNDVQIFDCNNTKAQQWVFVKSGPYLGIRNAMGRCLDVAGGINANRTGVQIFDCNGTKAQQWQ
jgi:Ricin-type beta-trefoil lectin domain